MNEVQTRLLEILKWFDEFARKNDLRYYALGGTMLGAYRHHGFIPWDDDIDVGMPRPDYERFVELMKNENGRFVLETPYSSDKNFLYSASKLYDTTTTVIENVRKKLVRGLWVDIFALDGMGNTIEECKKHMKKITRENLLLTTRMATIRPQRSFLKNCAIVLSNLVPDCIFKPKKLQYKLEGLRKSVTWDDSIYAGNTIGYGEKEIMEKRIWGKPKDYLFEGIAILGVEFPEEYLSTLYGDWSKLPPEEKRFSGHDFIKIDLNTPYIQKQ